MGPFGAYSTDLTAKERVASSEHIGAAQGGRADAHQRRHMVCGELVCFFTATVAMVASEPRRRPATFRRQSDPGQEIEPRCSSSVKRIDVKAIAVGWGGLYRDRVS